MSTVNMDSIGRKIKAYAKSEAGKEKIKEAMEKLSRSNKTHTALGYEILNRNKMIELTEELISVIKKTAASYDLPLSVMKHFDSLNYIIQDDGNGAVESLIYFADDLSRNSLDNDLYTGDGIDNIVALFNNGYVASSETYGWWEGHKPTNGGIIATDYAVYVKSKIGRPSLHFMQRAIEDFASAYKGRYPISVELNEYEYDGNYAGSLSGTISAN